jgi:tRNA(fMet)-specific endonuclease VapC
MILLDTSILIELFRTKDKSKTQFYRLSETEEDFAISAITHYEILIGSNKEQNNFWKNFLQQITVIPFDTKCSLEAINIYKTLKARNKLIELADLLIAATAIANEMSIATNNTKHFSRIESLNFI